MLVLLLVFFLKLFSVAGKAWHHAANLALGLLPGGEGFHLLIFPTWKSFKWVACKPPPLAPGFVVATFRALVHALRSGPARGRFAPSDE